MDSVHSPDGSDFCDACGAELGTVEEVVVETDPIPTPPSIPDPDLDLVKTQKITTSYTDPSTPPP